MGPNHRVTGKLFKSMLTGSFHSIISESPELLLQTRAHCNTVRSKLLRVISDGVISKGNKDLFSLPYVEYSKTESVTSCI